MPTLFIFVILHLWNSSVIECNQEKAARGNTIRLISAREVTRAERKAYEGG